MEFWPIFDIFHELRPYLCSKQDEVGFHKHPTHRRRDDEPFFYSGVDRSWLGMAQKWSILDQNWPNMAGLSTLQSGPKGPKRDQYGQPKSFWSFETPFGSIWTLLVEILKFMLDRDGIWSRLVFELVIWHKEVTLVNWTQPSSPLCLWQCLDSQSPLASPQEGEVCPGCASSNICEVFHIVSWDKDNVCVWDKTMLYF